MTTLFIGTARRIRDARRDPPIALGQDDAATVWVEQDARRVETLAALGRPRAVRRERVQLARTEAGHQRVPVLAGPIEVRVKADDAARDEVVGTVEQQHVDAGRPLRVDAQVDPARDDRGAQGIGRSATAVARRGTLAGSCVGAPAYSPTLACIMPPSAT